MASKASDHYERAMEVRRAILGDEHVDRAIAKTTDFTRDFQQLLVEYAWGQSWARPGLDRRIRCCITIALMTALNRPEELRWHLRGAVRQGVTMEEIREVLMQTAIYCGVPAANEAFSIAQEELEGIK